VADRREVLLPVFFETALLSVKTACGLGKWSNGALGDSVGFIQSGTGALIRIRRTLQKSSQLFFELAPTNISVATWIKTIVVQTWPKSQARLAKDIIRP
jgi:hypothetical protein